MVQNINLNGTLNPVSLNVPGAYVNVLAPPVGAIPGVPTNILGIVGTAQWGPVNSPMKLGNLAAFQTAFGTPQARRYDLGTALWAAGLQGAANFLCVRVTDNTDAAASIVVQSSCVTLTARYTGTLGNSLTAVIAAGTAASSYKITLSLPGQLPEVFDNITGTSNAFWINLAAAINLGQGLQRGPSNLCVAAAGAGTTTPTLTSYTLTGGTDGATTITSSILVGTDGATRKGMYALRNGGAAVGMLADCGDPSTWSTQLSFALSEQLQMVDTTPSGDTLTTLATEVTTGAVNSPWFKVLFGDWCYFNDTFNNVQRLISPQSFYGGYKVANGPQQSALNKPLYGIVGTQKSAANQQYSFSDLQTLAQLRVDVIGNPSPGGSYFSCLLGCNTSSIVVELDDSYCTLTNFLALSLAGPTGGGQFVGQLATVTEQRQAASAIAGLLQNMTDANPPLIGNAAGTVPYSVSISTNTNGVQTAVVAVQYLTVVRFFVVNLTAGSTVLIAANQNQANTQAQQLAA